MTLDMGLINEMLEKLASAVSQEFDLHLHREITSIQIGEHQIRVVVDPLCPPDTWYLAAPTEDIVE